MTGLVIKLDLIQTLGATAVVPFAGYSIRRRVPFLDRDNIPAPVVGDLLFALASLVLRQGGQIALEFDTLLQAPLMTAFFATVGFGASVSLLRARTRSSCRSSVCCGPKP